MLEEAPDEEEGADVEDPLSEEAEEVVPPQETMTASVRTERVPNKTFFFIRWVLQKAEPFLSI